ncbi:fumarylacetoacetase, partial [Bacteroidota bacterium]
MNSTNNPSLTSWLPVPPGSDFPIQNIPFGIFRTDKLAPRAASRIGDTVIDIYSLASLGYFHDFHIDPEIFLSPSLNGFIALGKPTWRSVRKRLSELFESGNPFLRDRKKDHSSILHDITNVEMLLPVEVGDYTDFYSSIEHATNVGIMFRDPANALLPNWRHIPVGYHGRASSIVVSGTPIHRPKGQTKSEGDDSPLFGPSKQLDFELEMAFITGNSTSLGDSVSVRNAEDYIFGMVLFNDLSARDIQKWEYVPLGPFLGKNFGSVASPWIVTLDALEPFRVAGPKQEPEVLPYLKTEGARNFDIQLDVLIRPEGGIEHQVSHSNFKFMYWNMAQQLAHQTVNGCNINVGDMYASGTISGPTPDSYGSML